MVLRASIALRFMEGTAVKTAASSVGLAPEN